MFIPALYHSVFSACVPMRKRICFQAWLITACPLCMCVIINICVCLQRGMRCIHPELLCLMYIVMWNTAPGWLRKRKNGMGGVIKKVDEEPKEQYKTNMLSIYICMLATCNLMFLHPYFNPHSFWHSFCYYRPIAFKCEQKESVTSIG